MKQETRWNLMGEPILWGSDVKKGVCCARYWSRAEAGDGGGHAIDCWVASIPEEGRREEGNDLRWGMEGLEGEGPAALG